jgi:hypothetical protein
MTIFPGAGVQEIRCPPIRIESEPGELPKTSVTFMPGRRPSKTVLTPSRLRVSAPTLAAWDAPVNIGLATASSAAEARR